MSRRFSNFSDVTADAFDLDPSGAWSACGWIYQVANTGGEGDLLYIEPSATPGSAYAIRLGYGYDAGPTLEFRAGDGTSLLSHSVPSSTGQWYHCAITYDGATARAYLDGAEVASQALSMSGSYDTADLGDFALGASTVELAQIKVWEGYALSPTEVALERDYWPPQSSGGDVYAWWQLDSAAPTVDSSGNGHTLSGGGAAASFTPPGVDGYNVSAVGSASGAGAAASTVTASVSASGIGSGSGVARVSTSEPTGVSGASSVGGRGRSRRRAR